MAHSCNSALSMRSKLLSCMTNAVRMPLLLLDLVADV
jgi:hypothetical protein